MNKKLNKYQRLGYQTNNIIEIDRDDFGDPIKDYERRYYTFSIRNLRFNEGSEFILFSLTPMESKILHFSILTMDKNFQFSPDIKWKTKFNEFLSLLSKDKSTTTDSVIRNGLHVLKKKKAIIKDPSCRKVYWVNPLYFAKRKCNRKGILRELLERNLLPENTYSKEAKKIWHFDGFENPLTLNFVAKNKIKPKPKQKALTEGAINNKSA